MLSTGFHTFLKCISKEHLIHFTGSLKIIKDGTFDIAKLILNTIYTPKLKWMAEEIILLP